MPLQAANQFQLVPEISRLGSGFQQGQQIAGQFQLGQQRSVEAERAAEKDRLIRVVNAAAEINNLPTHEAKLTALVKRKGELQEQGIDFSDTQDAIDLYNEGRPEEAAGLIKSVVDTGAQAGLIKSKSAVSGVTSAQKDRGSLIKAIQPALDANGNFDKSKANAESLSAAVDLGLVARASLSAQERIALNPSLAEQVVKVAGLEEAKKETSKLSAQLKLKPKVEAAVVSAVSEAKSIAEIKEEKRGDEKAIRVYEAATKNLAESLSGTTTGPFVGFVPAMTANAQIANGAVAMMAPVLKQLFRSAGEGTFTDSDQKMLIAMVPTRDTLPEARVAQLAAIDAIVKAKLGNIEQAKDQKPAENEQQPEAKSYTSSTGIKFTVE